jgi:hypothetical protein
MAEDEENFAPVWEEYRRRRRQFLIAFFGVFALLMATVTVSRPLGLEVLPAIAVTILMPVWLIGWAITAFRFSGFYCPRCDRPFFSTRWYHNQLSQKCLHCGLPKWATKSPPGTRLPGLD